MTNVLQLDRFREHYEPRVKLPYRPGPVSSHLRLVRAYAVYREYRIQELISGIYVNQLMVQHIVDARDYRLLHYGSFRFLAPYQTDDNLMGEHLGRSRNRVISFEMALSVVNERPNRPRLFATCYPDMPVTVNRSWNFNVVPIDETRPILKDLIAAIPRRGTEEYILLPPAELEFKSKSQKPVME